MARCRLILELKDGWRFVDKCLDDPLKFHSVSLWDLNLPVAGIRSFELKENTQGDASAARLTATNGDVLGVQFVAPSLPVETGFGKSELPVKMIRNIKAPPARTTGRNG